MSKKIHSQDSNFEEIWKEMDEIEPLTPPPVDVEAVSYTHLTLPTKA